MSNNISETLINRAKDEIFANRILSGFRNELGNVNYTLAFEYFLENHSNELNFYKQHKSNGYNCVALYKNVVIVGIGDFKTSQGRKISELQQTDQWFTYCELELKKLVLKELMPSFWDKRFRRPTFKSSANNLWFEVRQEILNKE